MKTNTCLLCYLSVAIAAFQATATFAFLLQSHQQLSRNLSTSVRTMAKKLDSTPKRGISEQRRKQLGILDDEEEYDLDVALTANTDSGITKIIAGSFLLTMVALLVVGLVIPSLTDFGEGVCSPIQNGGRC